MHLNQRRDIQRCVFVIIGLVWPWLKSLDFLNLVIFFMQPKFRVAPAHLWEYILIKADKPDMSKSLKEIVTVSVFRVFAFVTRRIKLTLKKIHHFCHEEKQIFECGYLDHHSHCQKTYWGCWVLPELLNWF